MTNNPQTGTAINLLLLAAAGEDKSAYHFLNEFASYLDKVRDVLKNKTASNHELIGLFAATNIIYSMPFYTRNFQALQLPVLGMFHELADGLKWEQSSEEWKRQWSSISELGMISLVIAVATLTIGFSKAQEISASLKELAWASVQEEKVGK